VCELIVDSSIQVESDDEEKKALLIEENIQLLEESERVINTSYTYPNALLVATYYHCVLTTLLVFVDRSSSLY
jgi:hypothetical protein